MQTSYDTIVIGGGQAGLAAGYHLQRAGVSFAILEASDQPGGSWPAYYDSLRLFSPARYSALPGRPFPGPADRYPARDEVIAYLRDYAAHFRLPVLTGVRVAEVAPAPGGWRVRAADGTVFAARAVIAASGAFHRPNLPAIPGQENFGGRIIHSASYRRPEDFAGQRVIVVGAGNSAVQIAVELAGPAEATLATRQPLAFQAQRPLGRDIHFWWWLTGLDRLDLRTRLGAWLVRKSQGVVLDAGRYRAAVGAGRPRREAMFDRFTPDGVAWSDSRSQPADAVIFATGYRPGLEYLAGSGALDADGQPLQRGGISTALPGLYFVGLNNQRTFSSATLRGVGPDAARVVRHLRRAAAAERGRCCGLVPA